MMGGWLARLKNEKAPDPHAREPRQPPELAGGAGFLGLLAYPPAPLQKIERVDKPADKVGRCKPSIHAAVPLVPPVPPEKHRNEIDREAFEERAAIMEFDGGLSRAEAERLAALFQQFEHGMGGAIGAGDTVTASRWWLIHYPDRDPVEVACCPEATHADILERHPDAVAAEPFTPTIRQPSAPLTFDEETAIRAWLALIEETDPAIITEVIGQCQRDADARDYFTGRAVAIVQCHEWRSAGRPDEAIRSEVTSDLTRPARLTPTGDRAGNAGRD
jgi:hypothetical protein